VKDIYAGNERPEVNIHIAGNPTFYFPGRPVNYQVSVQDKEDGASSQSAFDLSRLFIKADYLQSPDKVALPAGHEEAMAASLSGKSLMESLDCQSCHKIAEKSVGPAFKQVSEKYQDDPGAMDYLPHKIINGGSGVWGETAMPAHPGLAVADAKKIVTWVLSLGADSGKMHSLPEAGSISLRNKYKLTDDGVFYLQASYTDKGGDGLSPLTGSATVTLRNPYLHAASADQSVDFSNVKAKGMQFSVPSKDNAWLAFKDISLNGVSDIEIGYGVQEVPAKGWKVELHLDSPEGTPAGATVIGPQAAAMKPATAVMKLDAPDNKPHDLYFVFRKLDPSEASRPGVTGFRFEAE
jgi:cytochrome c551/c552